MSGGPTVIAARGATGGRWRSPRWSTAPAAGFAALIVLFPLLADNDYYVRLGTTAALTIVTLVGLNLIYGYAGQVSVGHIAFYGIGAYATALLMTRVGWTFWLAWPAGIVLSGAVGLLVGIPVLRLRGFYLLVATFGFGLAAYTVFRQWQSLTGGPIGVTGISRPEAFGFHFSSETSYYALAVVAMALALALMRTIARSPFGRTLTAIREGEVPVQALGLDTTRAKLVAFVLSTAIAGASGGLFAPLILYVSPESFTVEQSILLLAVLVIGGLGHQWGAIIGGILLVALTQAVSATGEYQEIVYGAVLLGAVLFMREGVVGAVERGWSRLAGSRRAGPSATSPAAPVVPAFLRAAEAEWPDAVLEVRGLACRFGELVAVEDLDLRVGPGELVGLIGPNGAGKSTVINAVTGVTPIWRGELRIGERDARALPIHRRARLGVGRTFQTTRLFTRLSVMDNVLVGLHAAADADRRIARTRARQLLDFVELGELADAPASSLPFGRRHLLELARALAAGPRVLLLDEPAAGLNDAETDRLAAILRELRSAGIAVVLVEHDLRLVLGVCDRVVVLASGRKLAEGLPEAIEADERVIEAYMGRRRGGRIASATANGTVSTDTGDATGQRRRGNFV